MPPPRSPKSLPVAFIRSDLFKNAVVRDGLMIEIFPIWAGKKEAAEPQRAGGFLTTLKCRRDQDRERPQTGVLNERKRFGLVNTQTSPRARAKVKKATCCVFSVTT
jgi:hypothetical protein